MIKFGTGGWRAVIGDEFTKKNIQLLAQAMCNKMKAEGKTDKGMIIGYEIFVKRSYEMDGTGICSTGNYNIAR